MSSAHLFVYGSLIVPKVHEMILGRSVQSRAAVLLEHRRRLVAGKLYPGMVAAAGSGERVQGRLLLDLSPGELQLFVRYEHVSNVRESCVLGG